MHCCPSTSTCCDRENKRTENVKINFRSMDATASLCRMQTIRTECVNGNALHSQDAKMLFSAVKDDCYRGINKKRSG